MADLEELEAAFIACRDRCFGIALQITGDRDEAADLTQEAFLRARRRLSRFRGDGSLEAWISRIAVNLSLKHVRWRQVRTRLRHMLPLPRAAPDAEWLAGCNEDLVQLARALEDLPPRQRAAFVLRHAQELGISEVADLLGVSVPTAKTHLARAVRSLRARLYQERDDE